MVKRIQLKTLAGVQYSLPFDCWAVVKECERKVESKLDGLIIITGSPGSGKSNMGKGFAGTWSEVINERPFLLDYVHFNPEKVIQRANLNDNKREPIDYDEAVQGGSSTDGQTKIGRILRKMLITKRKKEHLYITCVDSLKELNDKLIERATVWYHVFYVRMPNGKYRQGFYKTFSAAQALRVYKDLKERKVFKTEEHYIYQRNRMIKNFPLLENVFFPESEYDTKKDEETNLLDSTEDKHMVQRNKAIVCALEHGVKRQVIAKAVGLAPNTISEIKTRVANS